ncbi:MAG: polyphosphate kinase 1 [Gemmatimonadetes bacterium]|nr:polyphosphate kinase 1 [Gemmatimonadota bacterium]MYJ08701.1 polyphosphate kinase 1 [Gemmatimonadota bacterium]
MSDSASIRSTREVRATPARVPAEEVRTVGEEERSRGRDPAPTGDPASAESPDPPTFTTPADPTPIPPRADEHDFARPEYYLNRELTWLNFNFRVLHEAEDPRTPLLERLKFLSIVGSNLDEFFMKRIGGLKQQVGAGIIKRTIDGRTPAEQIDQCYAVVRKLESRQRQAGREILALLADEGIRIVAWEQLSKKERKWLRLHYVRNIYPLVTPQATDPAHPFPFISNLSLNLLVTLRHHAEENPSLARVKVPVGTGIPRFVKVDETSTWVPLEVVMANNLDLLFPGMRVEACEIFRVTRNAIYDVDEDMADDLLELIETGLRKRRLAPIVRLQVEEGFDPKRRKMLANELGLKDSDIFDGDGLLGLRDLMALHELPRPGLKDPAHHPAEHPDLLTRRPVFDVIREQGPVLLHHPYQAFDTSVLRFLREACRDPKVRAIKMTFYRMAPRSGIIDHLVQAARAGKQVAVVIELQARFDEAANIQWANELSAHGIHVTYGVLGLKTHCKVILVVRQDEDGLRRYAHIGTGNYHVGTARQYCDHGLLTCDSAIGADLTELFNYLTTGYRPKRKYWKILSAPKHLRGALLKRIEREVKLHSEDSPGRIQFQMNALEDPQVTRALYRASSKGVAVDLIARDSCRIRPGIPGLSENIRVISIVGRFLQHSRIYYFHNGGDEEYYIGSADCMARNLSARVEALVPVEDVTLRAELRQVLDIQLADRRCAWEMGPDGSYTQRKPPPRRETGTFQTMIAWGHAREFEGTRLRNRRATGLEGAWEAGVTARDTRAG